MSDTNLAMHYVSTRDEFREILAKHDRFWFSNCGCRQGNEGGCKRSRMDVCLSFQTGVTSGGSGLHEASRAEVEAVLREAEEKHLVCRPFRDEARAETIGSCFCCDDCCGYFLNADEKCDKGALIELTKTEGCTDCGACVDVCYFKARKMVGDKLAVDRDKCYGCGLCRDVCPADCITMAPRT
jgi:ferredoxin